jgi:hypothetical protein
LEGLENATILFAIALAFALLIERLLEIIKSILDLLDSHYDWHRHWTSQAQKLGAKFEQQLSVSSGNPPFFRKLLVRMSGMLLNSKAALSAGTPVISGDAVRAFYLKMHLKLAGSILGILIAFFLGLDILSNWNNLTNGGSYVTTWYGLTITGIALGLGSAPVHKIITGLERLQKSRQEKQAGES